MKITRKSIDSYVKRMRQLNDKAYNSMLEFIDKNGIEDVNALIEYAHALATKYGEGASELACMMYDEMARASKAPVKRAIPAQTATYGETAKAIHGSLKQSPTGQKLGSVVARMVKQAGADTTLQNAKRDGAYFAWVPVGDTCAYCQMIGAIGWQKAGKTTLNGTHAEHIHANCDCQYVVDFTGDTEISGYNPERMQEDILKKAYGERWEDEYFDSILSRNARKATRGGRTELNTLRRLEYKQHADSINERKREEYRLRQEGEE